MPLIPAFLDALLRRQQFDKLVEFAAQETPAAVQMLQQAVRLVLGDDTDAANAGIDAIGQREIDDAELAAERHGRLGAPVGQRFQAAAAPTGENQRHGVFGQQTDKTRSCGRVQDSSPGLTHYGLLNIIPHDTACGVCLKPPSGIFFIHSHCYSDTPMKPNLSAKVNTNLKALLKARHHDPFSFLGLHQEESNWSVRAFLPFEQQVEIQHRRPVG